jgi:hypothetical protein
VLDVKRREMTVPYGRFSTQIYTNEHATVGFAAEDGTYVKLDTPHTGSGRVDVLYLPDHPERAQIDNPLTMWGGQALLLFAGLGLLAGWRRIRYEA